MRLSLEPPQLTSYLRRQLEAFFPDDGSLADLARVVDRALERTATCFARTSYTLHRRDGVLSFSHLVADQYVQFIYYASHVAWQEHGNVELASKLFALNKALHGFHCMYDTELPESFIIVHGTGIVLGKARYGNELVVMHGVTVGANFDHEIPVIGERVVLYPGSSVIGRTSLGRDSCVANGAFVADADVPAGSLVIGRSPELHIKRNRPDRLKRFYLSPSDA